MREHVRSPSNAFAFDSPQIHCVPSLISPKTPRVCLFAVKLLAFPLLQNSICRQFPTVSPRMLFHHHWVPGCFTGRSTGTITTTCFTHIHWPSAQGLSPQGVCCTLPKGLSSEPWFFAHWCNLCQSLSLQGAVVAKDNHDMESLVWQ